MAKRTADLPFDCVDHCTLRPGAEERPDPRYAESPPIGERALRIAAYATIAADAGALAAALALRPGGAPALPNAIFVCLLLHTCCVAALARGRPGLSAALWTAAPFGGLAALVSHPVPPALFALAANIAAGAALAAGLAAGRRAAILAGAGFCAFAIGAWDPARGGGADAAILVSASLMVLAAAAIGARLGPAVRAMVAQARRSEGLVGRLDALEQERRELLAARDRDSERAAGLVRMNADLVGVQLELESNYRVIEEMNTQLERLAATDALTNIPNRRAFEEMLDAQMGVSDTSREPVSIMLLDVDRFKLYNDTYGHIEGDELLQELAMLIRDEVRDTDLATRYGGEEFAILLPMTGAHQAMSIAERVRIAVEGHPFLNGRVTVSIGVAATSGERHDARGLLMAADAALYQAKAAGRNRVVCAGGIQTAGGDGAAAPAAKRSPSSARRRGRRSGDSIRVLYTDSLGGIEGLVQQPSGTILSALLAALDLRDHETEGHSQRVARYALRLGIELSQLSPDELPNRNRYLLDPGDIRELALGAMLHDIGKLHVPDAILRKNGPLDDAEWVVMKRHPAVGADLVSRFVDLAPATTVVRFHHERWDGGGYPERRAGTSIPLVARIFSVCDTLDAITSDRPYRSARPFSVAIEEITNCSGRQFDPVIVDAFLRVRAQEWEMLSVGERTDMQALAA